MRITSQQVAKELASDLDDMVNDSDWISVEGVAAHNVSKANNGTFILTMANGQHFRVTVAELL